MLIENLIPLALVGGPQATINYLFGKVDRLITEVNNMKRRMGADLSQPIAQLHAEECTIKIMELLKVGTKGLFDEGYIYGMAHDGILEIVKAYIKE